MGWWDTVKSIGNVVTQVVRKVYEVCTSASAIDAYDKLEKIINKPAKKQEHIPSDNAPDFFGTTTKNKNEIEKKLSKQNQAIVQHDSEIKESRKLVALQIELTRLRASADLIDRAMKNVKIHASSLLVHHQNMRNINGLIDDVNTLRYGLKAVIATVNYNANLAGSENGKARKIENVDIERNDGAISQVAAYDAFDRTRELLRNEVIELSSISTKHLKDIKILKSNAADLGGDIGERIIGFVDKEIIPIIKNAESAGLLLKSEVSKLPAAIREEDGSLIFENGNIKLEQL